MRLLLLCLLLTATAFAKPAFEVVDTTYRNAAQKAFEYGNYVACDQLVSQLIRLYEGLRDNPKLQEKADLRAQVQGEIDRLKVGRVFVLGSADFYSDAIAQGQALFSRGDLAPELRLQAALGTILAARKSRRPAVAAEMVEPATRLAEELGNKLALFALRTFSENRRFEQKRPSNQEMWDGLAAAWAHLQGWKPDPKPAFLAGDALVFLTAERFWNTILLAFANNEDKRWRGLYDAEFDRVETLLQGTKRTDWWLAYLNEWLEDVEFCLLVEEFNEARTILTNAEKQFVGPYYNRIKKAEPAHRQACKRDQETIAGLAATFRQDNMPVLDTKPLDFSLLAGSASLIRARQLGMRARLLLDTTHDKPTPAQQKEVARLLEEARELQGSRFLSNEDVRWLLLRAGLADMVTAKELLIESELQGYRPGMVGAYSYQGFNLSYHGQKAEAVEKLKKSITLYEQYLEETGADESTLANLRSIWQKTYDLLVRLQLELGDKEGAYSTLGRRQQLQSLASAGEVSPEASTLRGQAAALEQEIATKRSAGQDSKPVEELLAKTRGEYNTVIAKLRQENPRYASALAIRPVSFAQQQGTIPTDTVIVQYFPAGESLYLFVATREELKIRQVAVTDAVLTQELRAFRAAVQKRTPPSERLYQLLIEPVEAEIAAKPVVAFIPTGMLTYLPFGALSKDGKYLISRKQCVTLLKSADLDRLGQPANTRREGLLAFGNPDGTLPAAEKEATDVATLFGTTALVGKQATADRLGKAGPVAYVHLATHGVLNPRDPSASYVLLASGPFSVESIYNLKLDGVRLVTLSACQTALGEVNPGSELTTLADAFALAGADAVVASLWSVDDRATEELMSEFYRRLKAGENLAHALQGAQLKLLEAGKPPFFWAPFVLIGDWR